MNIMFIDVETSGLSPEKHSILKLAYIIYNAEKKEILEKEVLKIKHKEIILNLRALEINKIDLLAADDIKIEYLGDYIAEKIEMYGIKYFAAYNSKFDVGFIRKLKTEKFIPFKHIDVMQMFFMDKSLANHKLETVCKKYNVNLDAHNPESDVNAALELFKIKKGE